MSHLRERATCGAIERGCSGLPGPALKRSSPGKPVHVRLVSDDEIMTVRGDVQAGPCRGILDFRAGTRCKFRPEGSLETAGL